MRPLYVEANLVIVPTTVSAGTNVKVLEAMAMQRAVVSTTSGCAGLGLLHGHSVWVADTPEAFAAGIATLIADPERRAPNCASRLRPRPAQFRLARHRRKAARNYAAWTYFALSRFANRRYAPGTPAGNWRNQEYDVKM